MPKENKDQENENLENENKELENQQEEFVSKDLYSKTAKDMMTYKKQLKEQQAKINDLIAQKEADEKEKMEEEKRYEELYRKAQEELEQERTQKLGIVNKFLESDARNRIINRVGGFKKPEYAVKLLDLSRVIQEDVDGKKEINDDLVEEYAKEFMQNHPELLKSTKNKKLPPEAANGDGEFHEEKVNISGMNQIEKMAYYKKLIQQEQKAE